MQAQFADSYEAARATLKTAAERQQRHHDSRVVEKAYKPKELVLKSVKRATKFDPNWEGPFVVKRQINDVLVVIADKRKSTVIHHDRLKPYRGDAPAWARKMLAEM